MRFVLFFLSFSSDVTIKKLVNKVLTNIAGVGAGTNECPVCSSGLELRNGTLIRAT